MSVIILVTLIRKTNKAVPNHSKVAQQPYLRYKPSALKCAFDDLIVRIERRGYELT